MSDLIITTSAYGGANKIRIDLYKATDSTAIIDTRGPLLGPLASTTWTFPGLNPGDMYVYKVQEVDPTTNNILQTIINDNVSIQNPGSIEVRLPEDLIANTTIGFNGGTNSVVLDGTGGKPDFRGWEIVPFEIGTGPMQKLTQYTWNAVTGTFTRTDRNFLDFERYPIEFIPRRVNNGGAIIRDAWSGDLSIYNDYVSASNDFGKNVLLYGITAYLKFTLPDIFSVPAGRLIYFEVPTDANAKCAEITCSSVIGNGNLIMWPKAGQNSLYIKTGETLAIYRQNAGNGVSFWRVKEAEGNFKTIGEFVSEYANQANVINKLALTDAVYNNVEHARFYNQYILNLPPAEVVNFVDWATGTNRYKYSFADANGNFHVPDLRNLYERSSGANIPGTYQANQNKLHNHPISTTSGETTGNLTADPLRGTITGTVNSSGSELVDGVDDNAYNAYTIKSSGGNEARPETYVSNKYVRC